jgi:hypothetical protein
LHALHVFWTLAVEFAFAPQALDVSDEIFHSPPMYARDHRYETGPGQLLRCIAHPR